MSSQKYPLLVAFDQDHHREAASSFCSRFGCEATIDLNNADGFDEKQFVLHFSDSGNYLLWYANPRKPIRLSVDFIEGANAHRRYYGGGKGQAIAKAVGIQTKFKPTILDATAGQGGDAFVFASLGCQVTMFERSPVAHVLLDSALERGKSWAGDQDGELLKILRRMTLHFGDSLIASDGKGISALSNHDIVYLDPMFPQRKKSAAVKKEMRIFHEIVGEDGDSDALLHVARDLALYRVVVKRPKGAPCLADVEPTYQMLGKSTRFDIYVNKALPSG